MENFVFFVLLEDETRDHLGIFLKSVNNVVRISGIDEGSFDAEFGGATTEVTISAAVDIVAANDVIAGTQQGCECRRCS